MTKQSKDSKRCLLCGLTKPVAAFPKKSGRNESTVRRDKRCKECKAKSTKEKRRAAKCEISNIKKCQKKLNSRSKQTIEPRIEGTNRVTRTIDFASLEEFCGQELEYFEKYDTVQRFNEFISILREGYEEIVGHEIYIKKD